MSENKLFKSILLLEDEASHALFIKRALREFCDDVRHVERVAEGLSLLSDFDPELIITDLRLPDTQGVKHVEDLRIASRNRPVIVLTSSTLLNEAIGAMKLGARDFIVKDFGAEFSEVLGLSLYRVYSANRLSQEKLRLQRETAILRIAIENSADGLAIMRHDGVLNYSNRAFDQFVARCGGSLDNLSTFLSAKVQKNEAIGEQLRHYAATLGAGGVWQTDVSLVDDPNRAYQLSLSMVGTGSLGPEIEAHGECVVWVRDVSDMRRRERFQREILSTTTHDLKGPLGAIMLSSELLMEMGPAEGRQRELALRIGSSAKGAVNLIDELLSARRIQEGTFILKPVLHNVCTTIAEASEDFQTIAAAKKVRLEIDLPSQSIEAQTDKLALGRAVGNLLSNALKFTPRQGSVALRLRDLGDEFRVEVQDSGSGMEPADVTKLFQRFARLEKHEQIEGSGLGLFVVRSIVNAHGGSIEVASSAGQGSTFALTFPKQPAVDEKGRMIAE